MPTISTSLLESLLACAPERITEWCETQRNVLRLELIQAIKEQYVDFGQVTADPLRADVATRCALLVAEQMRQEPLALPLAHWARGNWAKLYSPQDAIQHYRIAEAGYWAIHDELSVARLQGNLVGVLAECGHFTEAEDAYQAAKAVLQQLPQHSIYLLFAEQNYGWLLHSQGRYGEALASYKRATSLAEQNVLPAVAVEISVNRNWTLGMMGRLMEVERNFWEDRSVATSLGQLLTIARIDLNLGELYSAMGRPAAALQRFQIAQQTFVELGNDMEVGTILARQATLLRRIGEVRASIHYFKEAYQIFHSLKMLPQVGDILVNLAVAYRLESDYKRTQQILLQADEIWHQLQNEYWCSRVLIEKVMLAIEQSDIGTAKDLLQKSTLLTHHTPIQIEFNLLQAEFLRLEWVNDEEVNHAAQIYEQTALYAQTVGDRWLQRRAVVGHGKLLIPRFPVQAQQLLEEASTIDNEIRQTLTIEELKASFHRQNHDLFSDMIQIAMAANEPQRTLLYIWQAKAGAFFDLAQAIVSENDKGPQSQLLQTEIERLRQQLATLRWQHANQADPQVPDAQRERTTPEIAKLEQRLLELRRTANQYEKAANINFPHNPTPIIAKMDADLLFEYMRCGDTIIGVSVDRNGSYKVVNLGEPEIFVDLQDRIQLSVQNVAARSAYQRIQQQQTWIDETLPLLAQCFRLLVQPLMPESESPLVAQHILIAACEPLFLLPFTALWTGQQYWGECCLIEQIPSGAFLALPQLTVQAYSSPLIIAASSGAMTAVREEAKAVAFNLPQSAMFVDAPSITYLRQLECPPRILHIAAHNLLRQDAPIFSAFQLTSEVLSVEMCYDLPVSGTELVTLSGCVTAAGQETGGALLAFQTAFLIAGAKQVLSSLWPVADDATVEWMALFYKFLANGYSPVVALKHTQKTLRDDPQHSHPAIWAAFALVRR